MEVVPHEGKRLPPLPFQGRNVEEWSTLDSLTGMLEHARVQKDHWAATTCNSSHHFGKVIDSRARNLADGSTQQRQQTKQLEVFQANIPGGSVQVIRSQSLTTSSWQGQSTTTKFGSGSSWSTRANERIDDAMRETDFDNLKLALNPLDLSSQKMKASVGRSGSISSRRPPSRPRSIVLSRTEKPGQIVEEEEVADGSLHGSNTNLSQMARVCQQYHEEAKNHASFQSVLRNTSSSSSSLKQSSHASVTNGKDNIFNKVKSSDSPIPGPVTLSFLLDQNNETNKTTKRRINLVRKKSCSSEDIRISEEGDAIKTDEIETSEDWKRSSKARRSLQLPLQARSESNDNVDKEPANHVMKITKEIEARRKLVTNSLKNIQSWNNIETVLNRVMQNHQQSDVKNDNTEDELVAKDSNKSVKKKHSFITVESLKEVRGRLRRLGSPVSENKYDDEDDGIVTESKNESPTSELEETTPKSVKSYVYGMETLAHNGDRPTTITGTGSLESRSTNKSGSSNNSRSEEWYNRRKSYGFEQVNGQSTINHESNLYGEKNKVDSSTDSGICRSSETVANIPFWNKPLPSNVTDNKTSHTITIKRVQDKISDDNNNDNNDKEYSPQKGRKTVVKLGVASKTSSWNWNESQINKTDDSQLNNTEHSYEEPKEVVTRGKIADALRSLREKSMSNGFESRRLSEPITISIPVISIGDNHDITGNGNADGLLLKQTKEPLLIKNKYNINKQAQEDSNQFSTSYSKLLFGNYTNNTNHNDNRKEKETEDSVNSLKSPVKLQISTWNRNNTALSTKDEFKRHSIAVDEVKYMDLNDKEVFEIPSIKDKIASLRNHFESKSNGLNESSSFQQFSKEKNKAVLDYDTDSNANEKKQKKVEFCKTEVHFAAEPGRFNIVETDGKPPPNNMFRRRRKTIAETPARSSVNLPEIRFGDSQYEKNLLSSCDVNDLESEPSEIQNETTALHTNGQSVNTEINDNDLKLVQEKTVHTSESSNVEDTEELTYHDPNESFLHDDDRPRSILKSNIQKQQIESVKLNFDDYNSVTTHKTNLNLNHQSFNDPKVTTSSPWRSTVVLHNTDSSNKTEIQKLLKTLKPLPLKQSVVTNYNESSSMAPVESSTAADNGLAVRISSATNLPDQRRASWSVAERVHQVDDLRTRGFSTRVNFGSGETTVVTPEMRNSPVHDLLSSNWISDSANTYEPASSPAKKVQHVVTSNVVPTYMEYGNRIKSVETLVSTRSGHPKITSISLRYTDDVNDTEDRDENRSPFQAQMDSSLNMKTYKNERNLYSPRESGSVANNNKIHTSITSCRKDILEPEIQFRSNSDRRSLPKNNIETPFEDLVTDEDSNKRVPSQIIITNRKTQSPSSDSIFIERTAKQNSYFYHMSTARNKSMSPVPFPTQPVTNFPDYTNTRQIHLSPKQSIATSTNTSLWTSSTSKLKKNETTKRDDSDTKRKQSDETQKDRLLKNQRERRLSNSSSGRDSWLNTPKETQITKQRTNSYQVKRQTNISNNYSEINNKKLTTNTSNKFENSKTPSVRQGSESPIYQNREAYLPKSDQKEKDPFENLETESAILEELTRAADQILLAVNGYTDEESIRASSDDEYKKWYGKEKQLSKPLSTISEMPAKMKSITSRTRQENTSKPSGSVTQTNVATSRSRLCKTSSNSSVEGTTEVKSLLTEERSKRRAARLLQRASSRELLLQNTGASSSEDIASGTEATIPPQRSKQRIIRKTAKQHSSSRTYSAVSSHQNSTVASTSRTKDRVQRTGVNTVDEKEVIAPTKKRTDSKIYRPSKGVAASSSGKVSSQRSVTQGATTTKCERSSRIEKRPPERPGGGVGRPRSQHAQSKKKSTSSSSPKEVISKANKL